MLIIIILILTVLILVYGIKKWKIPKLNAIVCITGAPKTGKSTLAVWLAYREHKRRVRITKIKNIIRKCVRKKEIELPLLYSNIPLEIPYVPVTEELLRRESNYVYGSVVYLGEFSLIANSMNYKNEQLNEDVTLWAKLFGHQTRGGVCIIDTQCIGDCHYAVKRSISQYFWIHHIEKHWYLPWIKVYCREMVYSDDNNATNNFNEDAEESLKQILVAKKIWKIFDCYAYSVFTDELNTEKEIKQGLTKVKDIVSFNKYNKLKRSKKNEDRKKIR